MATAKQYEILFLLKAQLDSAFGTGFSSARTHIGDLQAKVKEYNQALRDISAYQKHTEKLNDLLKQYNEEKQKLAELKTKIGENGKATKEQTSEKEKLEKSIERLNQRIDAQKAKLKEDQEALKQDKVDTENLTKAQEELRSQLEATNKEMEKWGELQNTVNGLASTFTGLKVITDATYNAALDVDKAIISCMNSAAELQYTISAVSAVSGATEEENKELTALAKEMGATTIYTASQCAKALETMALAGMTVNEMISGLPAVVNLAAASGEDLTEMCSIVSDALNAFGLSGEKAVNEFADTLAKAATSSNTTISVLGESLSYVEGTAANLGYNIQDVATALAQMANNALKGSISGSALNTMLTRMSGANSNATDEMDKLGLSMYDVTTKEAKPLAQFLGELREAFKQFGDDSQSAQVAAYKLAGQRGMRGLLSIVNASDEEWEELTREINDFEGAASSISDIRMDNYTGQMYLLTSAWDAFKTTVGEQFLPVGTGAAELLTNLANGANWLAEKTGGLLPVLAAGTTGFIAVGAAVTGTALAIQALNFAITTMGINMMPILGVAAVAATVVSVLAGAFIAAANAEDNMDGSIRQLKEDTDSLTEAAQSAMDSHDDMIAAYEERRDKANALIDTLEELRQQDQGDVDVQEKVKATVKQLNELLPDLNLQYDSLKGTLSQSTDEMRKFNDAASEDEIKAAYEDLIQLEAKRDELEKKWKEAQEKADNTGPKMVQSAGGNFFYADTTDMRAAQEAADEAKRAYEELGPAIQRDEEITKDYVEQLKKQEEETGLASAQIEEITEAAETYGQTWQEAYADAYDSLSGHIGLLQEVKEVEETSLADMKENVKDQLKQWEDYQKNLETLQDSGIDVSGFWDQLTDGSEKAMGAAQAMAQEIKDGNNAAVEGLAEDWGKLNSTVQDTSEVVADGTQKVKDAWDAMMDSLSMGDSKLEESAVKVATDAIAGLVNGLNDDGEVQTAAHDLSDHMIEQIRKGAGTHSPSIYTTEVGENTDEGLIVGLQNKEKDVLKEIDSVTGSMIQEFEKNLSKSTFEGYGKNAMQGAIDGANSMKDRLVETFRELGTAAARAYADAQDINSPSKLFYYYSEMDMTGAAQGARENAGIASTALAQAGQDAATAYLEAKASRENQTLRGADLVTMFSPALLQTMRDRAPERMPLVVHSQAGDTESGGRVIQLSYAPVIHVQGGNMQASEIREQLREHDAELREMIEQVIYEVEDTNRRRLY